MYTYRKRLDFPLSLPISISQRLKELFSTLRTIPLLFCFSDEFPKKGEEVPPISFAKLIVPSWDKSLKWETWKESLQGKAPRAPLDAHFNQQRFGKASGIRYVNHLTSVPKSKYTRVKIQKAAAFPPSQEAAFQLAAMLTAAVPAVSESSSLPLRSAVLMSVLSLCSDICIHISSYSSFLHFHHNNTQHITKAL